MLPVGQRIYVVGDIHGRLNLLHAMHTAIDQIELSLADADSHELFLGDYVDRGPASAGVIEWLSAPSPQRGRICLRGNHEWLMQAYLRAPDGFEAWRAVGGGDTLVSYGIDRRIWADRSSRTRTWREFQLAFPQRHQAFLAGLLSFHQIGDYLFVHAGLRPGLPLGQQSELDMLWIRSDFLDSDAEFGMMVVHGHSPARDVEFRHNRIGVDTGAYATSVLSCVMLERDQAMVIQVRPEGVA
ncbi:serine/threonine protein phosphatase 1 [Bosea sp. 124]|nr:serine/threonine protein phosphatase 1 [Bosea sp. 124]